MNNLAQSTLARANAALRVKDYQTAIELYEGALILAADPLKLQIKNNLEFAVRKIGLSEAKALQQSECIQRANHDREASTRGVIPIASNTNAKKYDDFDSDYYKSKYKDLRLLESDGRSHYISHGQKEGRKGVFKLDSIAIEGCASYNPKLNTVIMICHEASRTGAPILGLRLSEAISTKFNVVVWLGKSGSLVEEFKAHAFLLIDHDPGYVDIIWTIRELREKYKIHCGILNSAVTCRFSSALFELKVPSVALIHEYAEYAGGEVMQVLATANRVIFPAKGVKQSADDLFIQSFNSPPSQTAIRHQGICKPPSDENGMIFSKENILIRLAVNANEGKPLIVMGCGWVQIRKGVEYFIHAAQQCKRMTQVPIRFIWIGGGFNPSGDLQYSAWLKSQVKYSGLDNDLIFFEETNDLSPFFEIADVFFLSSRLDPFPNVAIDAVMAGVPIVAFDCATGFNDLIEKYPAVGIIVPYLDAHAAAKSLIELAKKGKTYRSVHEQTLLDEEFSFAEYVEFLLEQCNIAVKQQREIETEVALLAESNMMTPGFHASGVPNYSNYKTWHGEHTTLQELSDEYVYVARWTRGLRCAKSRAGFSDAIAEQKLNRDGVPDTKLTPLARWFETGQSLDTHRMHEIGLNYKPRSFRTYLKVGIHIHAHYVEGLHLLLSRMKYLLPQVDLFITTTSEEKSSNIREICQRVLTLYEVNSIHTRTLTRNIGRDVGPFLMTLKEQLQSYDVVGHFHIKGTTQLEQSVVQQWQNFLLDTLIGQNGESAIEIIEQFEYSQDLGLMFQEDPCLPSWGRNYGHALALASELGFAAQLPVIPEYPTGNMFWARPTALGALLKKDWQWSDFPGEPVPYDGTVLHAIERLMPTVCEASGFNWMTVRKKDALRYTSP